MALLNSQPPYKKLSESSSHGGLSYPLGGYGRINAVSRKIVS